MSRKLITGVLRGDLGFEGLVVTDSLSMAGVRQTYDAARSAVRGLRAGNDVLLMPPSPAVARAGIIAAVKAGQLQRLRLEQAAARQIALLIHYAGTREQRRGRPPGSGTAASRALSAAAITSVAGPCAGRLVGGSVTAVGDPVAVANFSSAALAAGLVVLTRRSPPSMLTSVEPAPRRKKKEKLKAFTVRKRAWQARERRRRSAFDTFVASEDARLAAGTNIGFSGFQGAAFDGEIAVATNTPYVLSGLSAPVKIATFGDTPGAMSALLEVLLGKAQAPGSLPVPVAGVERDDC